MGKRLEIYTDGACSGNPGEAGVGVVIKKGGKDIWQLSKSIGLATNNIAEYYAVIYALQQALILKAEHIVVHTDSELLSRQCQGVYQVKHPDIKRLFDQIQHLLTGFQSCTFEYIPRTQNGAADGLAKKAVKGRPCGAVKKDKQEQAKVVALGLNFGEESPSSKG